MAKQKPDRLLVVVGAAAGAAFVVTVALIGMLDVGPQTYNPVQALIIATHDGTRAVGAELRVYVAGYHLYSRSATRSEDFDGEVTALKLTAPAAVVALGTVSGAWAVILLSRLGRRRETPLPRSLQ